MSAYIRKKGFKLKAELEELKVIEAEIADRNSRKTALLAKLRPEKLKSIQADIALFGFTAKELGFAENTNPPSSQDNRVKYRNPDNHEETWGGRGKRPDWLRDKLNAGANLADFAA